MEKHIMRRLSNLSKAALVWLILGSPLASLGAGLDDFQEFLECFAGPAAYPGPGCGPSDYSGDMDVDLEDFAALQNTFFVIDDVSPPMVLIPGGEFEMGCHEEIGKDCLDDELPVHVVYVDSFHMDVYEVTNEQYCAYLNDAYPSLIKVENDKVYGISDYGGSFPYCLTPAYSPYVRHIHIYFDGHSFTVASSKEYHPVVNLSWYGSAAYANWRSTQHSLIPCYELLYWECDFDADGYRLPTEAEWEYAARGNEHNPYYRYPWGDALDGSKANYWASGDPYEYETGVNYPWTTPVGYYDGGQTPSGVDMVNGYGLYDMAGNVYEWCNDCYAFNYYRNSPYDNPHGPASSPSCRHVLRGGSWAWSTFYLQCATRGDSNPNQLSSSFGFRLILD